MYIPTYTKTTSDIRCKYGTYDGWLTKANCYIELDHQFFIEVPYEVGDDLVVITPDEEAKTLFGDLSDIPVYHVNKEGKDIPDVIAAHKKEKRRFINRLKKLLFDYDPPIKDTSLIK